MATTDTNSSNTTQKNGSTSAALDKESKSTAATNGNDKGSSASLSGSSNTAGSSSASGSTGTSNELVKHAKDTVSHVADQAVGLVETQISQQQKKSVGELGSVVKALRGTREELGESFAGPLVDQAAEQIERASKFLETASPSDIVGGLEDFARREPLLFLGGAFAVGMLGARFLKSSSRRSTADSSGDRPTLPMRTAARSRVDVPRPGPHASSTQAQSSFGSNKGSNPSFR